MELPGKVKQQILPVTQGLVGTGTGRMECGGREYWEKRLQFGGIYGVIRKPSAMEVPWDL